MATARLVRMLASYRDMTSIFHARRNLRNLRNTQLVKSEQRDRNDGDHQLLVSSIVSSIHSIHSLFDALGLGIQASGYQ